MSTSKQRINITADDELVKALTLAAKREKVPLATKAAELIEIGLALEEDVLLAAWSESRSKAKKNTFISHDQVWN